VADMEPRIFILNFANGRFMSTLNRRANLERCEYSAKNRKKGTSTNHAKQSPDCACRKGHRPQFSGGGPNDNSCATSLKLQLLKDIFISLARWVSRVEALPNGAFARYTSTHMGNTPYVAMRDICSCDKIINVTPASVRSSTRHIRELSHPASHQRCSAYQAVCLQSKAHSPNLFVDVG
jgi:hypothetical protein